MAQEGARVVVSDIQEEPKLGKYHETNSHPPTAQEIVDAGGQAVFERTDVADERQVRALLYRAISEFGQLDVLVNNAGISKVVDSQQLTVEEYDRVVAVNQRALFIASKYAVPLLRRSSAGRIIHVASVHAYGGGSGAAYASSKAAVVNLARDTALELGPYAITCNVICPGYIETPIQDYLTPQQVEEARKRTALPRLGLPRDIGRAAVFLASDDAEWITGASLLVDGGFIAGT